MEKVLLMANVKVGQMVTLMELMMEMVLESLKEMELDQYLVFLRVQEMA
jgi:hypothetical protein